jgi:hypothetical protein
LVGEKVDEFVRFADIAPFGKGTKTVVDLEYRKAMEITVRLSTTGLKRKLTCLA